jgi:hypothetical protein
MYKPRMTQRQKTQRAYRAYLNILDTADWLRILLRGQIDCFGFTEPGFRLLEMLFREGAMTMTVAARRRAYSRQNLDVIVGRLEPVGYVQRELVRMRPKQVNEKRLPVARARARREVGEHPEPDAERRAPDGNPPAEAREDGEVVHALPRGTGAGHDHPHLPKTAQGRRR